MFQTGTEAQMIVEVLKWVAPIGTVAGVGWVLNSKFSDILVRLSNVELKVDLIMKGQLNTIEKVANSCPFQHNTENKAKEACS